MKDYLLNEKSGKTYVLNYELIEDSILIHFADGNDEVIPYTKENERKLLNKMKQQLKCYDEEVINQKSNNRKFNIGFSSAMIVAIVLMIILNWNVFICNLGIQIGAILSIGLSGIYGLLSSVSLYNYNELKKDFEKNEIFIQKQSELNEKLKKDNILLNVTFKTIDEIEKSEMQMANYNKDQILDLNAIDKISLKDLKTILENIKREEYFNFDYSKENEEGFVKKIEPPKM